jgi:nitroreductase
MAGHLTNIELELSSMEILKDIKTRRSIRYFKPEPIPEEVMKEI